VSMQESSIPFTAMILSMLQLLPLLTVRRKITVPARQIGHRQSYEEYLSSLKDIFKQVFCCTRNSGSLWIVANTFKNKSKINAPVTSMHEFVDEKTNLFAPKLLRVLIGKSA